MYTKRKVLAVSFAVQGILFLLIGFGGNWFSSDMQSALWYFSLCFVLVGAIQSIDFPCLISTIGAWTERRNRGIISGFWATCSQVGNIIGLQLAAVLLASNNNYWQQLMFIVMVIYVVFGVLIYFGFIADPAEIGLMLPDQLKAKNAQEVEMYATDYTINDPVDPQEFEPARRYSPYEN